MSNDKDGYLNFDEYIRQGEPAQRERAEAWRVAIGLQAVDGLKTSEYLQDTARRNIEGEITIDEARELVKQYYITKTTRTTALFTIKYLRMLGFSVNNDLFANHSWYFRNALVRANYRNVAKGIEYEPLFLIRFFRNLLLGEKNILKNRYMMINPPEEWRMQESKQISAQAQDKLRTSSGQVSLQVRDKFHTDNYDIINLVKTIGNNQLSVKEMMEELALKGRDNFIHLYLNPAIAEGFVCMRYPDKPRHPRQKYLLTGKGLALFNGQKN